jgi:hypothetical protein
VGAIAGRRGRTGRPVNSLRLDFDIEGAGSDVVEERACSSRTLPVVAPRPRGQTRANVLRPPLAHPRRGHRPRLQHHPCPRRRNRRRLRGCRPVVPSVPLERTRRPVNTAGGTPADTRCRLDQYLTGENIDSTDIVSSGTPGTSSTTRTTPHPHQGYIVGRSSARSTGDAAGTPRPCPGARGRASALRLLA